MTTKFVHAFALVSLVTAGSLSAQTNGDDGSLPPVSLEQKTALRCAAAFAIVADGQSRGNAEASNWPALGERGREFFVRVSAQMMDEVGLERGQVAALIQREAQDLWDSGETQQVMPSCLLLLETSGI
ncbi:hypothetical protein [Pontixanthobacter luteolus]|uniref:hypothetical protein n=1 Tax=Pontixanthobacter luteolus TaxID=295089 RepID=UPI002302ED4C|nr:hypothetical protein [Pontixanthobacter luteolus]